MKSSRGIGILPMKLTTDRPCHIRIFFPPSRSRMQPNDAGEIAPNTTCSVPSDSRINRNRRKMLPSAAGLVEIAAFGIFLWFEITN
jgi:hypothetical protein